MITPGLPYAAVTSALRCLLEMLAFVAAVRCLDDDATRETFPAPEGELRRPMPGGGDALTLADVPTSKRLLQ